jgi:tetratricopeptide (TPR) repeat protein
MELMLERAQQLVQLQRYKEAEKNLRLLLSQQPENPDALALLAVCQAEQGQLPEAMTTIQNAIGKNPDSDYLLYLHSLFLFRSDKLKEAERVIKNAISFHPRSPDYFGLLAAIKISQKEFSQGLDYANQGLAIDPDNLQCLNTRSNALFKLNRKDEAYSTIQEALNQDPENELTHTNLGWGLLERGDHKKALSHFREALKINPNYEYAKAGLIEGLKSRYLFYRMFLKYAFFINNLKGKYQWALLIGLYIAIRVINNVAENNPELAAWLNPIVYLYIAFALSTWIIVPLSNLFLRLNVYGKFALSKDEIRSSNFVAIGFFLGISSLIAYFFLKTEAYLLAAIFGITMMVPLSSMLKPAGSKSRIILIAYTVGLLIVGSVALLIEFGSPGNGQGMFQLYAIGVLIYSWVANAMVIRT